MATTTPSHIKLFPEGTLQHPANSVFSIPQFDLLTKQQERARGD
ncbi:hypothetical protein [Bradyrhizobium yuanmingense]|nr:hypothetical protein [Bradyrhizobium yuanmingense]MDF0582119.1 hypothetical protein [Bradyrhizobium yuanmingense]